MINGKCPLCHSAEITQKPVNNEDSEMSTEVQILLQRYSQLRSEIIARNEARYKLIRICIIIAITALGLIWKEKAYGLAIYGCIFVVIIGFIMISETHFIHTIAAYLSQIEEKLDEKFKISICGWEKHLSTLRKKTFMIHLHGISVALFILLLFTLFNILNFVGNRGIFGLTIFSILELSFIVLGFAVIKKGFKP